MIRFPNKPMADRVTERLLKLAAAQARQTQTNNVAAQGAQIDAALNTPIGDVAPLEGVEEGIVFKSLDV